MAQAHVFVFPSIVEGFGMVITEALSAGLPVITTPHTAGADILTEGVDGFVVPIRSPDALAERITRLAEDESRRHAMAHAARAAASRMSTSVATGPVHFDSLSPTRSAEAVRRKMGILYFHFIADRGAAA